MKGLFSNLAGICVALPVCVVALLLLLSPHADALGERQELEYAQAAMCAVGVALWLCISLLGPGWVRRWGVVRSFLLLAVFVAAGLVAGLAFPAGRTCGGGTFALHAYVLTYGAAIIGITVFVGGVTGAGWIGQATAAGVAILFALNVLIANVILDQHETVRNLTITATLTTNPMAAAGGALGYDVMRKGMMYEASKISYYNYVYPAWYVVCGFHAALGMVLVGLGRLCTRTAAEEEHT